MMITESQIKAAIRTAPSIVHGRLELRDSGDRGDGRLALLVRVMRERVIAEWYAIYYLDRKRSMAKIGSYPGMSLLDARRVFREKYAPTIRGGVAPERKRDERRKVQEAANTVRDLFIAYVDDMRRAGKRSASIAERILLGTRLGKAIKTGLPGGAAAAIGPNKPAADVAAKDIVPLLAGIHGRGSIAMAAQTRAYLSATFTFGIEQANSYTSAAGGAAWGITANPVQAIPADAEANRARDRYLSPNEFLAFWTWLAARRSLAAIALQLQMATGQRGEEILRISDTVYRRDEKMLFWDKTKNGLPHALPLPDVAIEILSGIAPNRHGLYFPHRHHPTLPATHDGVARVVTTYIKETGAAKFVARDLRRTWKTLAGRAAISKEMRDRLQNHAKAGDVSSRHYDRYDYWPEKQAAMAKWSAYLDRILSGEPNSVNDQAPVSIAPEGMDGA
jgi:hypothetical protein